MENVAYYIECLTNNTIYRNNIDSHIKLTDLRKVILLKALFNYKKGSLSMFNPDTNTRYCYFNNYDKQF